MKDDHPQPQDQPQDLEPIEDPELEAFLDQTMDSSAPQSLPPGFGDHPERRAKIDLQTRINNKLRDQFNWAGDVVAPALPGIDAGRTDRSAPAPTAPASSPSVLYRMTRPMRLAAAVLLIAVLGAALVFYANPFGTASLASVYRAEIEAGFVPGWVCETDAEFIETFTKRFQTPLRLREAVGLEAIGLTYNYALGPQTVMLLARVDGEPVIVFMGSTRLVDEVPSTGDRQLELFEKQIGSIRLFELSPFDEPKVLEHFELAVPTDERETSAEPTPAE